MKHTAYTYRPVVTPAPGNAKIASTYYFSKRLSCAVHSPTP